MSVRLFLLAGLLPVATAMAVESPKLAVATQARPALPAAVKPVATTGVGKAAEGAAKPLPAEMSPSSAMAGAASELNPDHKEFFEKKILPIFSSACYKCHSIEQGKSKGGLTLDTKEGLLKGGDGGAVIIAGKPEESPLIMAVSYKDKDLQMPPKGEKLSEKQIADLVAWVKMGAPDSRKNAAPEVASKLSGLTDKARGHWSFKPVKKPAIPTVKNRAWCITPVDAFVMEKLEAKGMAPSPWLLNTGQDVDKETLLRRATFDLIGLPPTVQEQEAFRRDTSPGAFAKVVERLLASPHYGERWGRFWLDSARYSDTVGADRDNNSDYRFPYAWTYRDWVIDALNSDMPYDQFVMHQLAADLIPKNNPKNQAALGFITVGERFGNNNDVINDRIDVVSKGFLGLTVACARCHDHMFDPIPTTDYYALHGVFSSILEPSDQPMLNTPDPAMLKEFDDKVAAYQAADRKTYYDVIEEAAAAFRLKAGAYIIASQMPGGVAEALLAREKFVTEEKLDEQMVAVVRGVVRGDHPIFGPAAMFKDIPASSFATVGAKKAAQIAQNKDKRFNPLVAEAFAASAPGSFEDVAKLYDSVFASFTSRAKDTGKAAREATKESAGEIDQNAVSMATAPFEVKLAYELTGDRLRGIVQQLPQTLRNRGNYNFAAINELKMTHPGAPARAMTVADRKDVRDSPVFIRGQAESRGQVVPRSFIEILTPGGRRQPFRQGSGRLELAQAIASKNNPLTARVVVNKVWMHHFGEGFVRTPDDLGTQAEAPSHPELIDYLSHYLMEQKWSLKSLHKLIMLSKVYQQSSKAASRDTLNSYASIDPENRLLWRANVRRLEFEAIRDGMLVMAGKLDRKVHGNPVNLTDEPYSVRRSVYGYIDRGNLPELMQHFDFGDPHMPNSKRTSTIVPQQALFLMNSPFAVDIARSVVRRAEVSGQADDVNRVMGLYKVVLQRTPLASEVALAIQFLREEAKAKPQWAVASKELTDKASKRVEEMAKRDMEPNRMDGLRAIRNRGQYVAREALTEWETLAQTLLLSNEAAYVN